MYGWMGYILRVNLSDKTLKKEKLDKRIARAYIGGSGLAAKILWDEVGPHVKPYDPNNKLILSV